MASSSIDKSYVVANHGVMTNTEMARHLGCSLSGITRVLERAGLHGRNGARYTEADAAYLRKHFATTPVAEIAAKLGRTTSCITHFARRLGLPPKVKGVRRPANVCCNSSTKRSEMCADCRAYWRAHYNARAKDQRPQAMRSNARPANVCCNSNTKRREMCSHCKIYWRDYMRQKMQSHLAARKAEGTCLSCAAPAQQGMTRCAACNARRNAWAMMSREEGDPPLPSRHQGG